MKFADIEVGKSYKNSTPYSKLVVFKTDNYAVVETDLPYPTVYQNNDENAFKNWVEVKRVKLYCSVWYDPKSGHTFIQHSVVLDSYERFNKRYLKYGYKLIREFVEEFSV